MCGGQPKDRASAGSNDRLPPGHDIEPGTPDASPGQPPVPPPQPPTTERRSAQRRPLHLPATLTQGAIERPVATWDIGSSGLCLLSARPIAPGSRWQLRLALTWGEQTRTVAVPVKVVYSSYTGPAGFKIGALLSEPAGEGADILRAFMAAS